MGNTGSSICSNSLELLFLGFSQKSCRVSVLEMWQKMSPALTDYNHYWTVWILLLLLMSSRICLKSCGKLSEIIIIIKSGTKKIFTYNWKETTYQLYEPPSILILLPVNFSKLVLSLCILTSFFLHCKLNFFFRKNVGNLLRCVCTLCNNVKIGGFPYPCIFGPSVLWYRSGAVRTRLRFAHIRTVTVHDRQVLKIIKLLYLLLEFTKKTRQFYKHRVNKLRYLYRECSLDYLSILDRRFPLSWIWLKICSKWLTKSWITSLMG